MPDRRVSVSFGLTINMGNYNSLRADASLAEDIPDGVGLDDAYKALWNHVFSEVDRSIKAYKNKLTEKGKPTGSVKGIDL